MRPGNLLEEKSIALLLDPDKTRGEALDRILRIASDEDVDFILAGGSITFTGIDSLINYIRERCRIPVILFPGNLLQLSNNADYIGDLNNGSSYQAPAGFIEGSILLAKHSKMRLLE